MFCWVKRIIHLVERINHSEQMINHLDGDKFLGANDILHCANLKSHRTQQNIVTAATIVSLYLV